MCNLSELKQNISKAFVIKKNELLFSELLAELYILSRLAFPRVIHQTVWK